MSNWWDDFSNNLATDLAPLIALLGESPTKQYLSECLSFTDILIFSIAPIGIITAVVSAIRVRGSPSLRAFIGHAQEGGGNAEAELCSSTSRDVCELYNNGGIARVFGRPKLLEVVLDHQPEVADFYSANGKFESAGIYSFREYIYMLKDKQRRKATNDVEGGKCGATQSITTTGALDSHKVVKDKNEAKGTKRRDWEETGKHHTSRNSQDVEANSRRDDKRRAEDFAPNPNLSLNVGIKKHRQAWFVAAALLGVALQSAILIWAAVARYELGYVRNDVTDQYAVPFTILGTILLALGIGLCAYLIESSTEERVFKRKKSDIHSHMYWVQPGNQYVGDQAFDSFAYSDRERPLTKYISSKKKSDSRTKQWRGSVVAEADNTKQYWLVWTSIGLTALGFIMQFLGLRACHSSVAVAQLGVMIIMSVVRALLRTRRMEPSDNCMSDRPDAYVGHELDWLALHMSPGYGTIPSAKHDDTVNGPCWNIPASAAIASFQGTRLFLSPKERKHRAPQSTNFAGNIKPDVQDGMVAGFQSERAASLDWLKRVYAQESSDNDQSLPHELARRFLYRSRLARMTVDWNDDFVATRDIARKLAQAITETAKVLVLNSTFKKEWENVKTLYWPIRHDRGHDSEQSLGNKLIYLALTRAQTDIRSSAWTIDECELEAVLGLWAWTLDERIKCEQMKREDGRTHDAQSFRPATVRVLSTRANGPYDFALWRDPGSTPIMEGPLSQISPGLLLLCGLHNLSSDLLPESGVQALRVSATIPRICAQELYSLFFLSMVEAVVRDIGGKTEIQEGFDGFLLTNTIISQIQQSFTDSGLGSRDDAFACTIPALISAGKLPSTISTLAEARKGAERYIKANGLEHAKRLLQWALEQCWSAKTGDPALTMDLENHQRILVLTMCECYRMSLLAGESDDSDMQGIVDLVTLTDSLTSPSPEVIPNRASMPPNSSLEVVQTSYASRTLAMTIKDYETAGLRIKATRTALVDVSETAHTPTNEEILDTRNKTILDAKIRVAIRTKMALDEIKPALEDRIKNKDLAETLYLLSIIQMSGWKVRLNDAVFKAAENGWYTVVRTLMEFVGNLDVRDAEDRTAITYAALSGDFDTFEYLLGKGSYPSFMDIHARSPLSYASEKGFVRIVEKLLGDNRVNADPKDKDNRTPLSWASQEGHDAVVEKLLENEAVDVLSKDKDNRTPLSWSASKGHSTVVKLLLEHGAAVDLKCNDGRTPLSWAAQGGHADAMKLLLEHGAVINSKNNYERTPLSWAAQEGRDSAVKLLLENGAAIDLEDKYCRTPLLWAAQGGHDAVVRLLLEHGAVDVDLEDQGGRTPLSWAASNGHDAVVKLLLERGTMVDLDDKLNRTPLSWAAQGGYLAVVEALLENGTATIDSTDKDGRTPLLWAASKGHDAVVKSLLEHGSHVDLKDRYNRTALSWAAQEGHDAVVKTLLEHGAVDIDSKDWAHRTPLLKAAEKGHSAVVKLLLDHGTVNVNTSDKNSCTPLFLAAQEGHDAVVKALLEHGADANLKDMHDSTPLLRAADNGHDISVSQLLRHGALVNSKDSMYRTALARAAGNGHEAVVKLLLEHSEIDVNSADEYGRTPLLWAAACGHEAVVKLLLGHSGIEVNPKDSKGNTPLSDAIAEGHHAIVKLLREHGAVDGHSAKGESSQ